MLSFLPLKTPEGVAAGLIRIENDAAVLSVKRPFSGVCTLFLEEGFVRLTPGCTVRLPSVAVAAVGIESGRPVFYAAAPACTLSLPALLYRLSLLERPAAIPSQPETAPVTPGRSVSAPKQPTQAAAAQADPAPALEQVIPDATLNGPLKDAPACDTPFCDAPSAHSIPPSASEQVTPADAAPLQTEQALTPDGAPVFEITPLQTEQALTPDGAPVFETAPLQTELHARDTLFACPSPESGADTVAPASAASDTSAEQPFDLDAALLYFDAAAPRDAETHAAPSIEETAADTRAFAATLRRACSVFSDALAEEQFSPDPPATAASSAAEGLAPAPVRDASAPSACPACARGNGTRAAARSPVSRPARSGWQQETERFLQEIVPSRGRSLPDLSD